jgi:hypothetical protein
MESSGIGSDKPRDIGLLHADPPGEFRLSPSLFRAGSDYTLRELELRSELFILFSLTLGSLEVFPCAVENSYLTSMSVNVVDEKFRCRLQFVIRPQQDALDWLTGCGRGIFFYRP